MFPGFMRLSWIGYEFIEGQRRYTACTRLVTGWE